MMHPRDDAAAASETDGGDATDGEVVAAVAVECPVCYEDTTTPMSLDCGHAFCGTCVDRLFDVAVGHGSSSSVSCPMCIRPNTRPLATDPDRSYSVLPFSDDFEWIWRERDQAIEFRELVWAEFVADHPTVPDSHWSMLRHQDNSGGLTYSN